jgi:hypothetical protein
LCISTGHHGQGEGENPRRGAKKHKNPCSHLSGMMLVRAGIFVSPCPAPRIFTFALTMMTS